MVVEESDFKKLRRSQSLLAKLCIGLAIITFITVIIGGFALSKASEATTDAAKARAETATKVARVASGITAQNTVRIYEAGVREHNDCLVSVENSNNNRKQHEAIIASHQTERNAFLTAFPSSSDFINASFDQMEADLRAAPLLASEPRKVEDCPALPEPLDQAIIDLANSILDESVFLKDETDDG